MKTGAGAYMTSKFKDTVGCKARGFELLYWLLGTTGIGDRRAKSIINEWLSKELSIADAIYGNGKVMEHVTERTVMETSCITAEQKRLLMKSLPDAEAAGKKRLSDLIGNDDALRIITMFDEEYPNSLHEIHDPPLVLYASGNTSLLKKPSISIVGTRSPSPMGRDVAQWFAASLAKMGMVVVSGMADGIDSQVHIGALKNGHSIGVLGAGYRSSYIRRNRRLYESMLDKGLLIGEYPPEMQPRPGFFPLRNRIISGMTVGTIVVEAGISSGALITARYALEQGRNVYVIPSDAMVGKNKGGHALVREGALLVDDPKLVLDDLSSFVTVSIADCESGKGTQLGIKGMIIEKIRMCGGQTTEELSSRLDKEMDLIQKTAIEMVLDDELCMSPNGVFYLKR